MPKELYFGTDIRNKLQAGVQQLARAVSATLGPKGRNVILGNGYGSPTVTKDGVTVARAIELKDPVENLGAQLVKDSASKMNDLAGDGTTTTTVLAEAIITEGMKLVAAGHDAQALRRGIEKCTNAIVEQLAKDSIPVSGNMIEHVASISANDPTIGKMIADAMEKVGNDGVITVEEGNALTNEVEIVDGMRIPSGYISPHFATDLQTMKAEYPDVPILVTDQKIRNAMDLVPLVESMMKAGQRTLVIIADDIEGDALATMIVNRSRGLFNFLGIKAPGYGDRKRENLEDIATLTGATLITSDTGLKLDATTMANLGQAKKIIADKDETTIIGGAGDKAKITERIAALRFAIEDGAADISEYVKLNLEKRIASLSGAVAVIKAGAASEVEMREIKHRIEDAVNATKAAIAEGIVIGGGMALLGTRFVIRDVPLDAEEELAVPVMERALEMPLRRIAENAGKEPVAILVEVLKLPRMVEGWNAATNHFEDLIAAGIVDPTKVTRCALQNAASVAGMILTTEASVSEIVTEPKTN